MPTPKGYPSQHKNGDIKPEHTTVEPIREQQDGLTVNVAQYVREVGTDIVEASSTTRLLNLTANTALRGDIIRFTSGVLSGQEVKVLSVTTNSVSLTEDTSVAASAADTIQILRHKYPLVDASGNLIISVTPEPILFTLDGSDQEVTEDTGTPANNRPLPVKLVDVGGDVNINASNLNLEVQLEHDTANPDSVQIGNGTNLMAVNASLEAQVRDDDANTLLGTIDADTSTIAGAVSGTEMQVDIVSAGPIATEVTLAVVAGDTTSIDGKTPALGAAVIAASVPVNIASDQTVPVSAASLPLPTGAATEATLSSIDGNITVCNTGAVTISTALPAGSNNIGDVDIASALPAGSNNIGDVDVASTVGTAADGAAEPAVARLIGGSDGTNLQYITTDTDGHLQVDVLSSPAAGSLDVVDFIDVAVGPVLDAASTTIPASASLPQEITASLAANVSKIMVNDTTGFYIGVFTGAGGAEVLECIIGPGLDNSDIDVQMSSAERVSIRHMQNSTITTGELCIQFIG